MAEFLDGALQGVGGGGASLTSVIDKTLSGGAVTEFGDSITLVDGGHYRLTVKSIQNGATGAAFTLLFDSDETAGNYPVTDEIRSRSTADAGDVDQDDDTFTLGTVGSCDNAADHSLAVVDMFVNGTEVYCVIHLTKIDRAFTTSYRSRNIFLTYDSGTLPTQIGVLANQASGIANGSYIKGVRLY